MMSITTIHLNVELGVIVLKSHVLNRRSSPPFVPSIDLSCHQQSRSDKTTAKKGKTCKEDVGIKAMKGNGPRFIRLMARHKLGLDLGMLIINVDQRKGPIPLGCHDLASHIHTTNQS